MFALAPAARPPSQGEVLSVSDAFSFTVSAGGQNWLPEPATLLHAVGADLQACAQLVEQCLKLAAAHNMEASLKEAWSTLVTGAAAAPGAHDECRTAGSPSSSTTEPDPQQDAACDSEAAPVMEPVAAAAATTEAAATTTAATEPPGVTWDAAACAAACDNCRVLASKHQQDAAALVQCIKSMVDAATAHVLHVSVKNVPLR